MVIPLLANQDLTPMLMRVPSISIDYFAFPQLGRWEVVINYDVIFRANFGDTQDPPRLLSTLCGILYPIGSFLSYFSYRKKLMKFLIF